MDKPTPSELVAIFPEAKGAVKRLIKEYEDRLREYYDNEQILRDFLSRKVNMFDVDICVKLALVVRYGDEKINTEATLAGLRRLYYLYYPPKPTESGITDHDIARAKEYPIRQLIEVKANKAKCVWHTDRHPSMHIYADNHAHCFSCGKGGDAIDVVQAMQGVDFKGAVRWLNSL